MGNGCKPEASDNGGCKPKEGKTSPSAVTIKAVPTVATAFFPLDEQLELPASGLMPHAHQSLVRLGARLPFEEAARELHALLGIQVSDSRVRRQTLEVGTRVQAIQTEQADLALECVVLFWSKQAKDIISCVPHQSTTHSSIKK